MKVTKTLLDEKDPSSSRIAFKIDEAAQKLGISVSSIRRLIKDGRLRPSRVLRHILIPADQLTELVHITSTEKSRG